MKKIYFFIIAFLLLGTTINAQIVNIPDANFKTKLLAANPNNAIAKNLLGNYFKIDTNNDGQIQVSEAIEVKYLNVSQSNISALTGIASFTNLEELKCSENQLVTLNLNSSTNLRKLSCASNGMTALNVSSLPLTYLNCFYNNLTTLNNVNGSQLTYLDCAANALTTINANNYTNLEELKCSNNALTTLNLTGLANLQTIDCSYNAALPLVDFSLHPNLTFIDCSNNAFLINSLNVTGLASLQTLICNNLNLTALDISDCIQLNKLHCINNDLTTLDANATSLTNLNCSNNNLDILLIKNGSTETILEFSNNSGLDYICADDNQVTAVETKLTTYGYLACVVNAYCTFTPGGTFYTIQGSHKFDSNANGCDAADDIIPNFTFTITSGTNAGTTVSDASGNYSIPVQDGIHTITPVFENPTYFTVSPASATANFPTDASPFIQDFCITANGIHNDLEVIIIPLNTAVSGFDVNYKIIYKNKGNQTQSGAITFTYDDAILDYVSATPVESSSALNSLVWNFINLKPFESREILVTLNLNSPLDTPAVNSGDLLNSNVTVTDTTDETPTDNTATLVQTAQNSYDPNDKTCLEGNTVAPEMIGKYVHYAIRFENTGTYPAQNIVVKDMIDTTKFDIATLVPMAASHSFITRITDTNKVEFIFENIQLPFTDANNDGYVTFKIKTKPTLVVGDVFSNLANIYFDYNAPIVTNTASTTVQAVLVNTDFEFSNYFALSPNPAATMLNIATKQNIQISSVEVYNTLGQLVLVIPNETTNIDVSSLNTGTYFIKINTNNGTANSKFIKQ